MNINEFYDDVAKENFYLGIVSQVSTDKCCVQIENLSMLRKRKVKNESIIPNTINYSVAIEDERGIFIAEVCKVLVQDTDAVSKQINYGHVESVFPEVTLNVLGFLGNDKKFELPGFKAVGINDKVFFANKKLVELYLSSIEANQYAYSNTKLPQKKITDFADLSSNDQVAVSLQPNTLLDHHLLVVGSTNSGKSTSALSIIGKLIESDRKVLVIDPTGEYRDAFTELNVLHAVLGVDTFLPVGEVKMSQWELLFQTNENTQGATLADAIKSLRYQKKIDSTDDLYVKQGKKSEIVMSELGSLEMNDTDFNLKKLPEQINQESVELNKQGKYVFQTFKSNANNWLVQKVQHEFEKSSLLDFFTNTDVAEESLLSKLDYFCASPNLCLYIDASKIGTTDGIGSMIIDLMCNYLIDKPISEINPFVLFVDEVHRYTLSEQINLSISTGLVNVAREGRKKGIFLFLTTQSPSDVPTIVFNQVGSLLIHRLTGSQDLAVVRNHLDSGNQRLISSLNQGEALLTSINLLQDVQLKFRKSQRIHHNSTPVL